MEFSVVLLEYLPEQNCSENGRRDNLFRPFMPDVNEIRHKLYTSDEYILDIICVFKCNAMLFLGIFPKKYSHSCAIHAIEFVWRETSPTQKLPSKINHYIDEKAIIRLIETSVGLHSLVPGDTQVYAQIVKPLKSSPIKETDKFRNSIVKLCKKVRLEVEKSTRFFRGNSSVERVGIDILIKKAALQSGDTLGILGTGQTAELVAKIAKENKFDAVCFGRDKTKLEAIEKKYGTKLWLLQETKVNAVVVCLPNNPTAEAWVNEVIADIHWDGEDRYVVDLSNGIFEIRSGDTLQIINWNDILKQIEIVRGERNAEKNRVSNICYSTFMEMKHLLLDFTEINM